MAKNKDIAMDNLKSFFKRGATEESPGNIPTGHFDLDFAIHYGVLPDSLDLESLEGYDPAATLGLPLGKIVELFGEEGAGKSSLAYRICGYAQKMGFDCCWIDTEHSYAENLAELNGVDTKNLLYSNLSNEEDAEVVYTAEDIFDFIIEACKVNAKGGNVGVIVLDSFANLVPKVRMEASAEKITPGLLARLAADNIGKIANYAGKYGVLIVFINQIREKIGVMFGNPETTPGGRTLKFNASLRIKVMKKGGKDADIYKSDDGGQVLIGRKARVYLEKNRFAKPFRGEKDIKYMELPIYYEAYFPNIEEIAFAVARQLKLVRPYKGELRWDGIKVEGGQEEFIKYLKYQSLTDKFLLAVADKANEERVILPPELGLKISEMRQDIAAKASKEAKDAKPTKPKPKEVKSNGDSSEPKTTSVSGSGTKEAS